MAAQVVERLGLKSTAVHLDITSFHVDGAYDCADGDLVGKLQLVRGYSRDHRPELNQVILELICENQAGLPVYMQALSGNSNDTKAFAQTVRRHLSSLKAAQECRYLVGDAALYCADTLQLLAQQQQLFVTRVPVTLNEAKQAVATIGAQPLTALGNGYHGRWQHANYAGVAQRWLLVRSEQASHREQQTLAKTCSKTVPASSKPSPKCARRFACEADAQAELSCFTASLMLLQLDAEVVGEPVYTGRQTQAWRRANWPSVSNHWVGGN